MSRVVGLVCLAVAFGAAAVTISPAQIGQTGKAARVPDAEDPALYAHIDYLVKTLDSKNRVIRRSVHQALVAIGAPALPALETAAARAKAPDQAEAATRIAKAIRQRTEKRAAKGTSITGVQRPKGRRRAGGLSEEELARILQSVGGDPAMAGELKRLLEQRRKERPKGRAPRAGGPSEEVLAGVLGSVGSDPAMAGEVKRLLDQRNQALRQLKQNSEGLDKTVLKERRRALQQDFRTKLQALLGAEPAKAFLKALQSRQKARADGTERKKKKRANKFERSDGKQPW
jgi:hypothetical protein